MDLKNKTKYSTLIEWSGFLSPRSNISKIEFFDFSYPLYLKLIHKYWVTEVISKGNLFKC